MFLGTHSQDTPIGSGSTNFLPGLCLKSSTSRKGRMHVIVVFTGKCCWPQNCAIDMWSDKQKLLLFFQGEFKSPFGDSFQTCNAQNHLCSVHTLHFWAHAVDRLVLLNSLCNHRFSFRGKISPWFGPERCWVWPPAGLSAGGRDIAEARSPRATTSHI